MLLIYLPAVSPRCEYIFEKIFDHEYGIEYKLTSDSHLFTSYQDEKINYSALRFEDEFYIKASPLLSENFIASQAIVISEQNGIKILFPNDETCDVGFDIFSAAFYMISRYEEYLPHTSDKYGRYEVQNSIAFQNNFLHTPIVDRWLIIFKEILQNKFPYLRFTNSAFNAIVTYDIDVAYKFKGRNFKRNIGAVLKDLIRLDFKNIQDRSKFFFGINEDPWDTYDYLQDVIEHNDLRSIFFFLLSDLSANDRNLSYKHRAIRKLITKINSFSDIGIHPSFKSSTATGLIQKEKSRLESIANMKVTKSRQHFLKFELPETYNALLAAGIEEDYSMGFPYVPGFRSGTSKPFYFYDLKNEKTTRLKLFPTTCMEGNFMQDEKMPPEGALENIFELITEVKNVHGTFISIWHNHTISATKEFKKWRHIHDQMIQKLSVS